MVSKLSRVFSLCGMALLLGVAPSTARAQSQASTGVIEGFVEDQSGAVLPGVTVVLRQTETGFERVVVTDEAGRFRGRLLPVGPYSLTAELEGFKKQERNLRLSVGATVNVVVTMEVGSPDEVVTISAAVTPLVDTSSSLPQSTVNEKAIDDLPINGRDFQSFVFLTPGAVQAGRNTVSLGGQKGIETNFQIDGADRNNPFFGGQSGGDRPPFTFSQESVREFVVLKDGFNAEFGRSTAGLVNVVTKSGTNDWHGSAFYLFQDSAFVADNISRRVNTDGSITENRNPALGRRHQYGGSFGGPIARDKAFFFFSTEHQSFSLPLLVEFGFNNAERATLQQFAPEVLALEGTFSRTDDAHVYLGKVDWVATGSNNFSFRYTYTDSTQINGTNTTFPTSALENNGLELDKTHQFVGSWNAIITPRLVNEFRFNYTFEDRPREANVNFDTAEVRVGFNARFGGVYFLPIPENDDRYQFVDNLSYNFGSHDLKFGFEYNDTGVDQIFFGNGRGTYDFRDDNRNGTELDEFLTCYLGAAFDPNRACRVSQYTQRFGTGVFSARVQEPAFFVQDQWKVSSRFTLNLGFRWEGQYNPSQTKPNTDFPAYADKIVDDTNNWAPRVGFAWDLTGEGKSVVRASGGIFYGRTPMLLYSNPLVVNGDVTNDVELFLRNVNGVRFGGESVPGFTRIFGSLGEAATVAGVTLPSTGTALPTSDVNLHSLDFQNPETYRYSFSFEQELADNWAATVSYSHSDTTYRQLRRNINLFPGVPNADGRLIYSSGRPFRDITTGRILLVESSSISNYDALTLSLNKRFSNRLQFQANYTLAKNNSIEDNERDASTIHPSVPDNFRADYGRSSLDIRHNFVFNGVLELPWDFNLSGIVSVNSGQPWNAVTGADDNGDGNRNDRPIIGGTIVERNAFQQPRFSNVDMRITKRFAVSDTAKAAAFIEFFNLFNARNYIVTNTTFGRTGFGIPTTQGGDTFSYQLGFRFDF